MKEEWIIDVLGDLRVFASKNCLPHLASKLEDALAAAHAELSGRKKGDHLRVVDSDGATERTLYREA